MRSLQIPLSSYRLQFNRNFTFAQAAGIVSYLSALGISHCYASPYLRARPGSMHGYDIIDHHCLNPEIGTAEDYERFVSALQENGMGQILDIVPNHMGVMGSDNSWWLDVLENGEASAYAEFFDIDWEPLKDELQGKVLVPVLGDQYGTVLDRGELKLSFDAEKAEFSILYFQHRFPVNPREYPHILRVAAGRLEKESAEENEDVQEFQSLISAFSHLPGRGETDPEKRAERIRDKEIHKRRLAALCGRSPKIALAIEAAVKTINGVAGDPASFDSLHELIKNQAYRLAYWRVAADDINYRRFFDINDLAALRQENEAVFRQTHELVLHLLQEGKLDGLRIDHPDGLYDPQQYFRRLQCSASTEEGFAGCNAKEHYIIAEKILTGAESLAEDWPIHGTTGYDFSNLVNALFVDGDGEESLTDAYVSFVGERFDFKDSVYQCKKLVMDRLLNSELNVLANHLSRIALADRHTCDFTLKSLRDALLEIVACFPVYRTYVSGLQVSENDHNSIAQAVDCAKAKSSSADSSVYDFIRTVLLTTQAVGHPRFYQDSVLHFAMRFQQYTSAVMATGLEDTAFYRYYRLASLNDVGGDPLRFGISVENFHGEIQKRAKHWPHTLVATSTHDSKRSEDVRARLNVLSEMPEHWQARVSRWHELNCAHKVAAGGDHPTLNDEYLLYQTLIGTWPLENASDAPSAEFRNRIVDYMLKAVREAKEQTSWAHPSQEYESTLTRFVTAVLQSEQFRADFLPFQRQVSYFGMLNSLAQTLLKLTVPGVPDLYQGNELWEFNLVDPDNRRAIDYPARERMLRQLTASSRLECGARSRYAQELAAKMEDSRIKMYVIWKGLNLRKSQPLIFQDGDYLPLRATGEKASHVIALARITGESCLLVAVPRLSARLVGKQLCLPIGADVWGETELRLPDLVQNSFRNLFTGEFLSIEAGKPLQLSSILAVFPVALLMSEKSGKIANSNFQSAR